MTSFVDRVTLHAFAGDGGNGCTSVRREKFKPLAGPDGGNGGRGGDITLEVDPSVTTLLAFHHRPHHRAPHGRPGQGSNRHGADGDNVVLPVPDGTVVTSTDGELLADLTGPGKSYVVARGGRGGLGNAALASPRRRAPGFALLGEPGEQHDVLLELKSVADVALVGFPSAGKSSLVAALSEAKPKIADYPFTTLHPNLGVVRIDGFDFVLADIPGLIEGAHEGAGIGDRFLGHVERTAVLLHLVDATLDDPAEAYETVRGEVEAYGAGLEDKPEIVALSKADAVPKDELKKKARALKKAAGKAVLIVSAASGEGVPETLRALATDIKKLRGSTKTKTVRAAGWQP